MNNPIIQGFIATSVPMVMPIVSIVLVYALKYISQKTRNEQTEAALTRITHTVQTIVTTYFANAIKTGQFNDQTFKTNVYNAVISQLPTAIKETSTLGINSLSQFITHKIEGSLLDLKTKYPDIPFNPEPAPTEQPSTPTPQTTIKTALEDFSKVILNAVNPINPDPTDKPKEA